MGQNEANSTENSNGMQAASKNKNNYKEETKSVDALARVKFLENWAEA